MLNSERGYTTFAIYAANNEWITFWQRHSISLPNNVNETILIDLDDKMNPIKFKYYII